MMANLSSVIHSTVSVSSKALVGLFRFAATDHTRATERLVNMPTMGFLDSLKYLLWQFLLAVLGALVLGASAFLLIAFAIPFVLHLVL